MQNHPILEGHLLIILILKFAVPCPKMRSKCQIFAGIFVIIALFRRMKYIKWISEGRVGRDG